jgi:hypothetical protein
MALPDKSPLGSKPFNLNANADLKSSRIVKVRRSVPIPYQIALQSVGDF